jgi:hypothetical protein
MSIKSISEGTVSSCVAVREESVLLQGADMCRIGIGIKGGSFIEEWEMLSLLRIRKIFLLPILLSNPSMT